MPAQHAAYLRKPGFTLLRRAGRHRSVDKTLEALDSAQAENAVLPQSFERIAENLDLALPRRVRRIEHQRGFRAQQSHESAFGPGTGGVIVSHPWPKNAV